MSDSQGPFSDSGLPAVTTGLVQRNGSALHPEDQRALADAVQALEHNNLATRFATALGHQLGSLNRFLPSGVSDAVNQAAEKAVASALNAALSSLNSREPPRRNSRFAHKALLTATGAAGGFFGLASLPLELPVSTILILRTIAEIARSEGEDLSQPDAAFACLQVFALGAHEQGEEFIDGGYFAVRGLLAKAVSEAGRYALERGISDETAPLLFRFISMTGARFGIVVSQKLAAQAIPLIGAAGGAAINYAFAAHFQSIASGHFTIRRLERIYGAATVRAEYQRLRPAARSAA